MRILLAVDGSDVSLRAVGSLIEHVRWFRESPQIHVLHVHAPIPVGLVRQHLSQEVVDGYYRDESEAALMAACRRLDAAKLPYQRHVHVGPPAETIVKTARQLGCELICMGTHGRGELAGAVLGSVAHRVLHLSERPVLFAK